MFRTWLFLLSIPAALCLPHDHQVKRALPSVWYQPPDHPVHQLFRRDPTTDGIQYAAVGSAAWSQGFPAGVPNTAALPQAWTDALNAAISNGQIPNIPPSTLNGNPAYPNGINPSDPSVCSSSYGCRGTTDIWDAPSGVIGVGFDDGPSYGSSELYPFLQQNNIRATHFMIGVNILSFPGEFSTAYDVLQDDIAVHTWTHPYMTTLGNLDVLGQLGWTMQLIHNSTGGRVPKYWRPPYGDCDNRVRAIAKVIFGMDTIIWNHDSEDWHLLTPGPGQPTFQQVNGFMQQFITGPKTPGLIILEHELSQSTSQIFINNYPLMMQNGWNLTSVGELGPTGSAWQNAVNPIGGPVNMKDILATHAPTSTSTTSTSTSTTSTSASSTASGNTLNTQHSSAASTMRCLPSLAWTIASTLAFIFTFGT